MKLAEFFVSLGFEMDGEKSLDQLDEKLGHLAGNAGKALAMFGSLTAGMAVMLHQAMETANGFRRFGAITGLSSEELQKWQYIAGQAGVNAEDVTSSIVAMQKQAAEIARGGGNPNAWGMLGLSPSANPFETIAKLRESIKGLSPAIAHSLVENLGVGEGVFAMLEMTDQKFRQLEKDFIVSKEQTKGINQISSAWSEVVWQINAVKNQLVAALIPALRPVLDSLKVLLAKMAEFTQWLNKSTTGAKVMKGILVTLATVIVAITGGLTALLGIIGAVTAAFALWAVISAPITLTIAAITAAVLLLFLMIEDFVGFLQGKDSMFGPLLKNLQDVQEYLLPIDKLIQSILAGINAIAGTEFQFGNPPTEAAHDKKFSGTEGGYVTPGGVAQMMQGNPADKLNTFNQPRSIAETNMKAETNIGTVHIDVKSPTTDPYKLGTIVADRFKDYENTFRQMPVYGTRK